MNETGAAVADTNDIWISVTEGAQITGYSRDHMQKLARDNWKLPEEQRILKLRRLPNGYIIWLPTLLNYIEHYGRGPGQPRKAATPDS